MVNVSDQAVSVSGSTQNLGDETPVPAADNPHAEHGLTKNIQVTIHKLGIASPKIYS